MNNSSIHIRWDQFALIINLVVVFWTTINLELWRTDNKIINNDVIAYYAYLPATFIYQDLSLNYYDDLTPELKNKLFYELLDNEGRLIKTTMGVSIFYFPFFIFAHQYARLNQVYEANGYSLPYRLAIQLNAILFFFLGLNYLRKYLLWFFSSGVVFWTLLAVGIGTNLFNYTVVEPGMSHVYTFFICSALLFYFNSWLKQGKSFALYKFGFLFALLVLVRPINGLLLIFFILYALFFFPSLKAARSWLLKQLKPIGIATCIALLTVFPQLIYWKFISGDWFFYSYTDNEHFFFNDPKILEGLFSYRKGWLLYTPIMTLAIIGFLMPYPQKLKQKLPVLIILLLFIYVLFSWWAWWYGGSFGIRAMIGIYPILAISMAVFFKWVNKRHFIFKAGIYFLTLGLIYLNQFQHYQYRELLIHYDSMNKKTYWGVFLKHKFPENFWEDLDTPDYDAAKKGERDL